MVIHEYYEAVLLKFSTLRHLVQLEVVLEVAVPKENSETRAAAPRIKKSRTYSFDRLRYVHEMFPKTRRKQVH